MLNNGKINIGILEVLTVTLVILKLFNIIHISWWFVFAPLWIPAALYVIIFIICTTIIYFCSKKLEEKKKE